MILDGQEAGVDLTGGLHLGGCRHLLCLGVGVGTVVGVGVGVGVGAVGMGVSWWVTFLSIQRSYNLKSLCML